MTRRRWRLSIVLSSNVLLLLLTWCTTTTKVVQSLLTSPRELERRLQKMSKEELEEICTERGFELIKDEIDSSTGQPVVSTHQDHVDAAWQCLQMEDLVVQDLHTQQQQQGTESSLPGRHGEQQQQHHYELSEQQHDDNDDNKARSLAQHILEELVPLPTPIKTLLGKLLIRLAGDVQELVHFVRRQFDAVVGVIRGRIAEHRTVLLFDDGHEHEEQQQDEEMEL